ncbi:MAG: hypothetical protein WBM78_23725, partial [Desulfobacterales bacterium]
HIDGTCEGDSPHLFTGIDGIAQIVLDNIKLPSEKAELLIPFFRQIRQQYGDPIALLRWNSIEFYLENAHKYINKTVRDFMKRGVAALFVSECAIRV